MKRLTGVFLIVLVSVITVICTAFCTRALQAQNGHIHSYKCEIIKQADCENEGLVRCLCDCGDEYTEAVPPLGHMEIIIPAIDATCLSVGHTQGIICERCEKILKETKITEKRPHNFVLMEVRAEPTCMSEGSGRYKCTYCEREEIMVIKPLEHNFQAVNKVPTCEKDGVVGGLVCTMCSAVKTAPMLLPALGHSYDIYEETVTATCTETGMARFTCSRCGKYQDRVIPLKEHTPEKMKEVAPTCEKGGLLGGTVCSVCKKVLEEQSQTPALGHSFSAWKTVKKATCTQDGKLQAECERCGALKTRPTPALTHSYQTVTVKASFKSDGSTYKKCKTCGKTEKKVKIPKVSHASLVCTSYVYNAKAKKPAVKLKNSDGKLLKSGTDYTVSYKNNKSIGTGEALVTLKGNYSGTKTLKFKILPGKVCAVKAAQTTDSIMLSWNKVSGAQKYAVYTYNKNTKKYTRINTVKTSSVTVKNLKAGTTYYYAFRAYANGIYGELSDLFKTATKCAAVTNVKLKVKGSKLNISWKKVSGASRYEVYASKTKDGKYSRLTTSTKPAAAVKLTSAVKYVKIRAVKEVDGKKIYGAYSGAKKVTKG